MAILEEEEGEGQECYLVDQIASHASNPKFSFIVLM